jgi:hypothetical protein
MTHQFNLRNSLLGASALVIFSTGLAWAQAYSHARIVRLSFEEGTVTVARPDAPSGAEASVNTPIQEGFKLMTADDGFAEVEFENTSTARMGQLSELDFDQLALDSNGAKLNGMVLVQGYATFNVIPEDGDVYTVKAGSATVNLASDKLTRFRVDLDGANVRIEVSKGDVDVSSPFGEEHLGKNMVCEIQPGAEQPVAVSKGITKDAWDEWVEEREDQAQLARRKSPPGLYTNDVTSLLYGWNDLYYYGNWAYVPDYGFGWIPSTGFGWTPYSYGQWLSYPGFGYTWVSFEPWGWLPFHYGGWVYDPNFGWCWIPGGFNAWSPSLVSWYQGPGWVGWSPRPPHLRPGGRPMPARSGVPSVQSGVTVMSTDSFRAGLPVTGHRVTGVSVTGAFVVDRPDVQPEMAGGRIVEAPVRSHTGPAVSGPGNRMATGSEAAISGSGNRPVAPSGVRAPLPARGGESRPSAAAGVVFDPSEGRFVNSNQAPAPAPAPHTETIPTTAETPRVPSAAHSAAPASSPQPAPRVAPRGTTGFQPAPESSHHAAPRAGVESSRPTGTFEKTLDSWGVGGSSRQSPSSSSGGWSAPSSSNSGGFGGSRVGGGGSGSGSFGGGARGGGSGTFGGGARGGGGAAPRSAPSPGPHR